MDGEGGRKRKMEKVQLEEEDENEKMEKFFALIRSTREVRQLMEGEKKKAAVQQAKPPLPPAVWNPAFRAEDFNIGLDNVINPQSKADDHIVVEAGPSKKEEDDEQSGDEQGQHKGSGGDGLDLNLSL